uniref:Thioester reductase (TE) domain-containing protein n=1 Tax=Odontella aurita TaxID=265563 RepID=A0A7S4JXS3_9STRA|mmetsp:Transcript_56095/g.167887  ORF Transcript_56095/g.167887 Transcript_56095/m.167887 type:complete len:204 (+) Transcript_56095:1897-2508(+)
MKISKGVVHAVGLLFDQSSGLATLNRLASGSGSRPDDESTYDAITRQTAFNAIHAVEFYARKGGTGTTGSMKKALPFVFLSAAEAGWPDVPGGKFVENYLAPGWMRRYLSAKRAVEGKLEEVRQAGGGRIVRPVIFRPSLIYSLDRPASLPPVAAFFAGNRIGLPFVDRPVTVQALSCAVVRAIGRDDVVGVQRFADVDALSQ